MIDLDRFHREESGRILSTLIRLLGDFDLAEESLQEAYAVALQKWPTEGAPANPRAWMISTARFKAIDRLRREQRLREKSGEVVRLTESAAPADSSADVSAPFAVPLAVNDAMFPDDRLRLESSWLSERTKALALVRTVPQPLWEFVARDLAIEV